MDQPIRPKDRFLIFGSPLIEEPEISDVVDCLRSGWLGTGPRVAKFEEEFRRYKGVGHAVAVSSCTAALHLSILAAGIGPGDEVITTPLTFCATVNAIIHAGATPVLADVDPATMNIDPADVREQDHAPDPRDRAGTFCGTSLRHGFPDRSCGSAWTEDHRGLRPRHRNRAQGAEGGTFGTFGCFSFYVTKNVVTGEGGMVLARDEDDAARIKVLALHGMSKDAWKRFGDEAYRHYQVVECGFKYNMMDLQAAIGIHQLRRVEQTWNRRKEIWDEYDRAFSRLPVLSLLSPEPGTRHGLHLYTLLIDERRTGISRDAFLREMGTQNIGVGVHYLSIPEHPYYQERFQWSPEQYPNAMRIGRQTVSIPLSAKLTDEDVQDVIRAVGRSLARGVPVRRT